VLNFMLRSLAVGAGYATSAHTWNTYADTPCAVPFVRRVAFSTAYDTRVNESSAYGTAPETHRVRGHTMLETAHDGIIGPAAWLEGMDVPVHDFIVHHFSW